MTSWIRILRCLGRPASPLAGLALAGLLAGCGPSDPPPAAGAAGAEVRGEPIAPAVPPATPAPTPTPTVAPSVATTSTPNPTPTPDPIPAPATSVAVASEDSATVAVVAPSVSQASTQPVSPTRVAEPVGEGTGAGTAESPLILGFEKLASFQYTLPDGPVDTNAVAQAATTNQIPATIKSLNNRFITLKGFMLPLKVEKGLVTELLIMRDQSMCCYGTVPRINEWVSVKMVGTGVKPIMDQAVTFHGKLKVGEMYENGYLVGIYALDGERMDGPLDM